jgi:hypothetical protein
VGPAFLLWRLARTMTDLAEAQRITHNTRHFSGNYIIVILILAAYAM